MLGGRNKHRRQGYTIIEVMIVLAVSSVMFVIASGFISGKQERTSFNEGVNEMADQVQSIIEQVTDGQYSDIPLNCTFGVGFTNTTGAFSKVGQGQNAPCVFLGKTLFMTQNSTDYQLYSMAGGRITPTSNDTVTALLQADPVNIPALNATKHIPQALTVWDVISTQPGGLPYSYRQHYGGSWNNNAIGFFQSQGDNEGGALQTGPQTISLVQVWGSSGSWPTDATHTQHPLPASAKLLESSDICLTDGKRYAEILIGADTSGANSSTLAVNVKMDGTKRCP